MEEVRAHQSVMDRGMDFGVVVTEVGASGAPVNIKVAPEGEIPNPVWAHVDCF